MKAIQFSILLNAAIVASPCSAASTIFAANFDDSILTPGSGAVTAQADYGSVGGGGTWGFGGTAIGYFGAIAGSTGDRALAVRHNTTAATGTTDMPLNAVALSTPSNVTLDAGGGGTLQANFGSPGGFSSPGSSTSISLDWGMYGTSNNGTGLKVNFIRGLDASGNEVFELLMVAGSTDATRDIFVRGASHSQTTISGASPGNGVPQGTNVVTSLGAAANSTSLTAEPTSHVGVGISLHDNMADFTFTFPSATGGPASPQTLSGVPINSAATSISRLEFSSIWSTGVNNQNKGYWLDNLNVTTIPEPSVLLSASLVGCLALLRRGRKLD